MRTRLSVPVDGVQIIPFGAWLGLGGSVGQEDWKLKISQTSYQVSKQFPLEFGFGGRWRNTLLPVGSCYKNFLYQKLIICSEG